MKQLLCLCLMVALCLPMSAANLDAGSLDAPVHTDLEVNKCVHIPASCYTALRHLTLDLTFRNATPSNGFYVAFGNDTGNGYLEFEEMQFQVGFDHGRWQLRGKGMVNTYACTNQFAQSGAKNLRMRIKVNESGIPLEVTFADNGQPFSFPGLDLSAPQLIPGWLTPPFSDLKVTRRGYFANAPDDSAAVVFSQDGIRVILR